LAAEWGTYQVRIDRSDHELLEMLHQKHRNVIKKAVRDEVYVKSLDNIDVVYECVRGTLVRQGLPYFPSRGQLRSLVANLPFNVLNIGCFSGQNLQGIATVVFDRGTGYYLYGGSVQYPIGGALNLLQLEVMKKLRDIGVANYDLFGARINVVPGSKYEGIQRFKSRFGASLKIGYAFRMTFSPLRYRMFTTMMGAYFRIKGRRYFDPVDQLVSGRYE
jgi:lipid II:glycine glycyltransferase (peptidoglycan interpeptide bridge formation enzyme)